MESCRSEQLFPHANRRVEPRGIVITPTGRVKQVLAALIVFLAPNFRKPQRLPRSGARGDKRGAGCRSRTDMMWSDLAIPSPCPEHGEENVGPRSILEKTLDLTGACDNNQGQFAAGSTRG
jgi:hypothetical protein